MYGADVFVTVQLTQDGGYGIEESVWLLCQMGSESALLGHYHISESVQAGGRAVRMNSLWWWSVSKAAVRVYGCRSVSRSPAWRGNKSCRVLQQPTLCTEPGSAHWDWWKLWEEYREYTEIPITQHSHHYRELLYLAISLIDFGLYLNWRLNMCSR